jgi:hypothetical protein
MDTHHVQDRYVKEDDANDEFNRYWIAYKWCAKMERSFRCGCGARHEPKWDGGYKDKTSISKLAARLYSHIKTPKHQNSISRQLQFVEHLAERFKKDIFHDQHEKWEQTQYAEFQEYEREHREFLKKRRAEEGFKLWLKKEEERIAREEAEEINEKNRKAMKDFVKSQKRI